MSEFSQRPLSAAELSYRRQERLFTQRQPSAQLSRELTTEQRQMVNYVGKTAGFAFLFLYIVVTLIQPIVLLSYIGTSSAEEEKGTLAVDDGRRKFLIFLSWFWLIIGVIGLIPFKSNQPGTNNLQAMGKILFSLISIVYHSFILSYLGSSFTPPSEPISLKDSKRNVIIGLAWFTIARCIFSALYTGYEFLNTSFDDYAKL